MFYPVAQVDVGQAQFARLGDLPQHVVGAVRGARHVGIEKRVDGRQAIGQHVDDADHAQDAFGIAKLHQARVDPALQQKLRVLVAAVLVHAAARVACALVAQIQLVMLVEEGQGGHARLQVGVPAPGAALVAVGRERLRHHAHGDAGLAAVAVRPVGEDAAAAKAVAYQFRIHVAVDQVRRRGHLRAGLAVVQVAARVGRRRVELQGGKR